MKDAEVLALANDLSEIERLSALVDRFAERHDLAGDIAFALRLSLEEHLIDVIECGCAAGDDHAIEVRLSVEAHEVTAVVVDDGIPFDPLTDAPEPDLSAALAERRVGGLGRLLIRAHMEELRYERRGDRNVFVMRKRLTSDRGDAGNGGEGP